MEYVKKKKYEWSLERMEEEKALMVRGFLVEWRGERDMALEKVEWL